MAFNELTVITSRGQEGDDSGEYAVEKADLKHQQSRRSRNMLVLSRGTPHSEHNYEGEIYTGAR